MTNNKQTLREEWMRGCWEDPWRDLDPEENSAIADWWLALRAKELGILRERIAGMADPYPVEIFPEPWDGWQKDIDELAKTKGRRIDCISAYYSRWQRKLAKEDALRIVDELIEKP